jgi:hypothetical protein
MTRRNREGAFGINQPPNQGITRTGPRTIEDAEREVRQARAILVGTPYGSDAEREALDRYHRAVDALAEERQQ